MTLVQVGSLVNPGGEVGSASGWTSDHSGITSPVVNSSAGGARTGDYRFILASNSYGGYYQDYALPTEIASLTAIGAIRFNPSVWQSDFSGDADNQRFKALVFNANSEVVQSWMQNSFESGFDGTFTLSSVELPLHNDAHTIRLYTEGERFSGAELSAYQDDYALAFNQHGQFRYDIGIVNPSAYGVTSGWAATSANLITGALTAASYHLHHPSSAYFYPGSAAVFQAQQTVDFVNSYDLYDALDTGAVTFDLNYAQGSFNDNDTGALYVEFLNSADTMVSSAGFSEIAADRKWQVRSLQATVPATARKVRLTMFGTRTNGNNLDARFTTIQGYLNTTSNYINGDNAPYGTGIPSDRVFPVLTREFPLWNMREFPNPYGGGTAAPATPLDFSGTIFALGNAVTNQSAQNGPETIINIESTTVLPTSFFQAQSGGFIVVTSIGPARLYANTRWSSSAVNDVFVNVDVNSNSWQGVGAHRAFPDGAFTSRLNAVSAVKTLNSGDLLTLEVLHASTASVDVQGGVQTWMGVEVVKSSELVVAQLGLSGNQAITTATTTRVNFDTVRFDIGSHGLYDANSAGVMWVTSGYQYARVGWNFRWASIANIEHIHNVRLNGTEMLGTAGHTYRGIPSTQTRRIAGTSMLFPVSSGDQIDVIAYQNRGSNLDVLSDNETWFTLELFP